MKKALIFIVILVAAFAIWFGFSRYLVSKLDGTGGVSVPAMEQYSSEAGVSFKYPPTYQLSSRTEGNAERQWDVLVLLPKDATIVEGGEGPIAITVGIYSNTEGLTLEQWIEGDARSNWKLSTDNRMTETTIGGKPAILYTHSGLYENDVAVVEHNSTIYVFSGAWQDAQDSIRSDFANLLDTVQFN